MLIVHVTTLYVFLGCSCSVCFTVPNYQIAVTGRGLGQYQNASLLQAKALGDTDKRLAGLTELFIRGRIYILEIGSGTVGETGNTEK